MTRRRLPLLVAAVATALSSAPRAATAQGRVSCGGGACGSCTSVQASSELERLAGAYLYTGFATVSGAPGASFTVGVGHQYLFGGEIDAAVSVLGQPVSVLAVRFVPLRFGLDGDWARDPAPSTAVLLAFRAGLNLAPRSAAVSTPSAEPYFGVDAEGLFWGQLVLAVRTGVVFRTVPTDPGGRLDIVPVVSISVGAVSSWAYGWVPLGTR